MVDEDTLNFQDFIEEVSTWTYKDGSSVENHLMLGNGFSIALFNDIFSYKALADRVESPRVKELFEKLGRKDFEYIMRRLTNALELIKVYPQNKEIVSGMESDLNILRETLIEAISRSHPESPQEISDKQFESCRLFLKNFEKGNKYTFNYDLLLYWVYMYFRNDGDKNLDIKDGFSRDGKQEGLTWDIKNEEEQNVYYIHGAMHLFDISGVIHKITWNQGIKTIREKVCNLINEGMYPMFISEGEKEHKLARIRGCSYLERAFHSLEDIKGNLFIFGHSLEDNDDHVFNQINIRNEGLINIFIGIFGDPNSADNQRIISKVNNWKKLYKNKDYYLYDATSANVWGK